MSGTNKPSSSLGTTTSLGPWPGPEAMIRPKLRHVRSVSATTAPYHVSNTVDPMAFKGDFKMPVRVHRPVSRSHSVDIEEYFVARLEKRRQFRVALSLLTVIGWNFVTWLPYFATYFMLTLDLIEETSPVVSAVMYLFLYSAAGFNTLIYASRCTDIKEEFTNLYYYVKLLQRKTSSVMSVSNLTI